MTTHDDQLFQLLSDFETWQDGDELNEERLVQHDLVLAHLARLYGGLSWHSQHFGLLASSSLHIEIQEHKSVALSHLLAVTATGKLLVCASAAIPDCDNQNENKGLFAIARPLKRPETLQKKWPEFPLYQVELTWQTWQTGLDEIVKTGEGIALGRLKEGQWDADYIPPVMSLATDKRLWQQALEIMNQVSSVASRDKPVAEQVLTLQQSDLSHLSPFAFWQAHCRCLVALKTHPKLAADSDYHLKVSECVSASCPWENEPYLEPLRSIWAYLEKRLDKESERQKGMTQLMNRVDQLARRDRPIADLVLALQQTDWTTETPLAFWQGHCRCLVDLKTHPKLIDDPNYQKVVSKLLSESFSPWMIGDGLEPLRLAWQRVEQGLDKPEKPAPKPRSYVSLVWYATSMVGIVLLMISLGIALLYQHEKSTNEMKAAFEKQLAALDNKQAKIADELSGQLTQVDNKHLQKANDLSRQVSEVDNKLVQKTGELSEQLNEVDKKHNKSSNEMKVAFGKQLAALDNKQAKRADELSEQLTKVDKKHLKNVNALTNQSLEFKKELIIQIENVAKTHSKELADQSRQFNTEIERLAKTHKDELENVAKTHSKELADQSRQFNTKIKRLAKTHNDKVVELKSALSGKIGLLDSKQTQNTKALENQLNNFNKLKSNTQGALKTHSEALETLSAQFIELKTQSNKRKKALAGQIAVLDSKQTQNAKALENQLVEIQKALGQIAALEQKLKTRSTQIEAVLKDMMLTGVFRDRLKEGRFGPEMIWIPAGQFRMGDIQDKGDDDEQPVHEVSIKRFAMSRYEVTFADYDKFAEATGRDKPKDLAQVWGKLKKSYHRDQHPVINVSWEDAVAYAVWLSEQTGKDYRLPTEAEWEYVARAGSETEYSWGDKMGVNQANCHGCGSQWDGAQTAPVGSFAPNAFEIYDMTGNVREWTCSKYEQNYEGAEQHCLGKKANKVAVRGGSYWHKPDTLRVADRQTMKKENSGITTGFRLIYRILEK